MKNRMLRFLVFGLVASDAMGARLAREIPAGSSFSFYRDIELPANTSRIDLRTKRGFSGSWAVACEVQGPKKDFDQLISKDLQFSVTDVRVSRYSSRRFRYGKDFTIIEAVAESGYRIEVWCWQAYSEDPELDEVEAFLDFEELPKARPIE